MTAGAKYRRKRYKKLREKNLCARCGKNSPITGKTYCLNCKEQIEDLRIKRVESRITLGLCSVCGKEPLIEGQRWGVGCKAKRASRPPLTPDQKRKHRKQSKDYKLKCKNAVFDHYGWECACCGESNPGFLTLDHVNNDGHKHRKETTTHMYTWVINNDFPEGFQTLCWNCNMGKYLNGGICPHNNLK